MGLHFEGGKKTQDHSLIIGTLAYLTNQGGRYKGPGLKPRIKQLCYLNTVQGRSLSDIVRHYPQAKAVFY